MIVKLEVNIDIDLLLQQKQLLLVYLAAESDRERDMLLTGLLNLLDHIHDRADPPTKTAPTNAVVVNNVLPWKPKRR